MQFALQAKPPVGILFDSDMSGTIDDALALALLYGFDGKDEARMVAISISTPNLRAAAFCEAVSRFYASATFGAGAAFARSLPIGMAEGVETPDAPLFTQPLARKDAAGAPVYAQTVSKLTDTADPAALLRNALSAQHDDHCVVVLAGPAVNLVRLLELPGAKELAARKVKILTVTGNLALGSSSAALATNVAAARRLLSEWPTPITAADPAIGNEVRFPAGAIEKDFAWTPAHPIADAYRAQNPLPAEVPTWDLAAALYAVRSEQTYFQVSEPGILNVTEDGRLHLQPSAGGKHRFLTMAPGQRERVLQAYVELASAKPIPRSARPRRQQDQEKKPAEPGKENPAPAAVQ